MYIYIHTYTFFIYLYAYIDNYSFYTIYLLLTVINDSSEDKIEYTLKHIK